MLNVGNWLSPLRRLGVSPLIRPPIFDKLIQWACGSPTTLDDGTVIIEDKKGKSGLADGREQIPSAYLEGDGSRYVNVPSITDADLPTNYIIQWDGKYAGAETTGLFGFDQSGADEYFVISSGTVGRFIFEAYSDSVIADTPAVANDKISIRLVATGTSIDILIAVNDDSYVNYATLSATISLSNKILQILTRGESSLPANHDCYSFSILNPDTDEYLLNLNFQDSNTNTFCYDASGNDNHGEIQNATGADRVESDNIAIGDMDSNGYSYAIRNELDNYDFSDGTNDWSGVNANIVSVVDSVLIFIATSTGGYLNQAVDFTIDEKYFIFAKVKANSNQVSLNVAGVLGKTSHSGSGQYEELYDIFSSTFTGLSTFRVTDERASLFENIEVDGDIADNGGVFVFNLTLIDRYFGTSYSSMTAEEVNAVKYEILEQQRWIDQALTIIAETGERSPNVNGFSVWYDSNGDRAVSQFTGLLKADLRVVDGVVDNGVDYEKWETAIPDKFTFSEDGIEAESTNGTNNIANNFVNLKPNTDYLIVAQYSEYNYTSAGDTLSVAAVSDNIFDGANATLALSLSEQRFVRTTKADTSNKAVKVITSSLNQTGEKGTLKLKYYEASLFTDPLTDPLPESGQPVVGNSVIQATNRYDLIQADDLTTTDMYDTTDPDNAEALVVPITGDVTDNPLYIREDPFCWLLYNETLNTEENEAVDKYLGFSAPLLDGASDFLLDGGDNQITGTPQ